MIAVSEASTKDILDSNIIVYFIYNNVIYKGVIVNKRVGESEDLYQVESPLGLLGFKEKQLYLEFNSLVQAITYEEPVRVSQEFKTWAV